MQKKKRHGAVLPLALLLIWLPLAMLLQPDAHAAGSVTDTLTVKVGYWGMEESDYVTKATYHWSELDDAYGGALETHYQAYSFFKASEEGTYQTVIDSARGFYITDLIDLVGVNQEDVASVSFYTQDQTIGYWTSFSHSELFQSARYYFEDLASYVTLIDNDPGYVIDPEVWNHRTQVPAMLALEDGWATYEAGYEHTAPNYESMGTGNRFRLLFGQTTPDEGRTNQTAKYTHSVYITLRGVPAVVSELPPLADQIGSGYTTKFDVSTSDTAFNDILQQLMEWNSSNEEVLQITGFVITPSTQYDDVVTVELIYDILTQGNASIVGSFMGVEVGGTEIRTPGAGGGTEQNDSSTTIGESQQPLPDSIDVETGGTGGEDPAQPSTDEPGGEVIPPAGPKVYELSPEVAGQIQKTLEELMMLPEIEASQGEKLQVVIAETDPMIRVYISLSGLIMMSLGAVICLIRYRKEIEEAAHNV